MKTLNIAVAAVLVLGQAAYLVAQTTIYQTGFEPPTYTTGPLAGQDGWSLLETTGPAVQTSTVFAGTQAVGMNATGTSGQNDIRRLITDNLVEGVVTYEVRFFRVNAGTSSSWNVFSAFGNNSSLLGLVTVSNGVAQLNFAEDTPAPDGQWNDFKMVFDFGTQKTTAFVNGTQMGPALPFSAPSTHPILVDIGLNGLPGTDSAFWDNLSITSNLNAPAISKSFNPSTIAVNGTSALSFTVTNPSPTLPLSGLNFADALPAGMMVAPSGVTGSCDGGTITATAGSGTISLSGATLLANTSCTFSVNVVGTTAGANNNSVTIHSAVGDGNTAEATLTVVAPPTISKAFNPAQIPLGGGTSLTFTIVNPNTTVALTGVAFTDTLPTGVTGATVTAVGASLGTCGIPGPGVVGVTATSITASGLTIPASSTCTIQILGITGTIAGVYTNTTGNVTSKEGGTGNTASALITVVAPPNISKTFGTVLSLPVGETTALSFTITNPNATVTLHGLAFTDTLPTGLLVATPNAFTGGCGAGATFTAVAGTNTIALSNGTLGPHGTCTFSVNVTGIAEGVQINTTSTVTSTEGGAGNTATASIIVGDPYQIGYAANLAAGDSVVNLTNAGTVNGFDPAGDICANVYVFAEDQQLIACCSCPLTPNHLKTLSVQKDLINNTLTPGVANAITVGLLVTTNPTGSAAACNASAVTAAQLTVGLGAYGTKIHALPGGSYGTTETPFSPVKLSASELLKLTQYCGYIQADGSGFGICGSCRQGAAGASRQ